MKLFKKVAAAVLAGVMALSMVACGTTTPVTPEVPEVPVDPTKPVEEQFFLYLNNAMEEMKVGETATSKIVVPTFENELKDVAVEILDAIAEGDAMYDKATGKVVGYAADLVPVGVAVYAVADFDEIDVMEGVKINSKKNELEYTKADAKDFIAHYAVNGRWLKATRSTTTTVVGTSTTVVTTDTLKATVKIGAATKTINGETCFVIVTKAA